MEKPAGKDQPPSIRDMTGIGQRTGEQGIR